MKKEHHLVPASPHADWQKKYEDGLRRVLSKSMKKETQTREMVA
jgi:hypothetical protein